LLQTIPKLFYNPYRKLSLTEGDRQMFPYLQECYTQHHSL
jgi:hypothetical protein